MARWAHQSAFNLISPIETYLVVVIVVVLVVVVVIWHPDILSGIAIATKDTLGCESFLSSKEIVQFLFEQPIE